MELLVTTEDLDPFPKQSLSIHNKPMGLLTSNYKSVVNSNYRNLDEKSLFVKRQSIKGCFYNTNCAAEVTLKVSLFLVIFLIMYL
ncbi:hypothetical protein C1T31_03830 [Hanstruepera neustonica]|uniref:Uncharacterized protein n=1 Tax=Hanstruepera neustonica TaxID=1445657 RepID=A0A2K1E4W3_9FLAO|nr:hypothetical protein [Hanstruepera neustonica]PNQ75271.1 hypothetical protein C1T31_03830 [Hanstruepera neustonica]